MAQLTIRLLGAPTIARDAAPITMDTRKATALLAYLAVTGRSHGREALAALLWPEYDDEHARAALRRTLSTLRAAVGEEHLAVDRETIRLIPTVGLWVDVTEFRARLAACRTHGHPAAEVCPACLPPLAEAAALYRDDFLVGFTLRDSAEFDDWQAAQAETLRGELAGALERLAAGQSAGGDFEAALASARRWLALDPLHEEAHRQVMRLLAWSNQRNAALQQYRECVRILERELGVAPLAETAELYEAIKENRLTTPDLTAATRPHRAQATPDSAILRTTVGDLPLAGRAAELTTLIRAYERNASGGYFLALEGEPGIGKTRLAEELLRHARGQGGMTITVRCYEGEAGVAYGPVADALRAVLAQTGCAERLAALPTHWLAEVARLLPELNALRPGLPSPPPVDAPGGQSRLFEGLRQVLSAICQQQAPTVLFFDDMHWADAASLDLLAYLVRRLAGQPLFILAAWWDSDGPMVWRLRSLAAEAQRTGNGAALQLRRLALADVLDLVSDLAAAGAGLPDGIGGRLYHETEGLPLFLAAYLDAWRRGAGSGKDHAWAVPRGVADLFQGRLKAVEDTARQVLQAAAIIGRSFDLETLQVISGRSDEEIVTALESLAGQNLLREVAMDSTTAPRYDFTLEKLRDLVYNETSLARRRLLHGRAARALVDRLRGHHDPDAQAAQIGRHFRLAGQDAEAAAWLVRAGDHAANLYANAEALSHYQAALALGHPETIRLHAASGDMHTLSGAYAAALSSYETAAALCAPDNPVLAEIEHKLGKVHARRGEWAAAETHFAAALDITNASGLGGVAGRIQADASLAAHAQGRPTHARALAQASLAAAESAGDRAGIAQAYNILGILARRQDDGAGATAYLERGLAVAETLPDLNSRIALLNNLALVCAEGGDLARATTLIEHALTLCIVVGDRHREAALRNNLADLLHRAGREDEAMAQLKQAVVIFAEIGEQAGDARPEIWKLTVW